MSWLRTFTWPTLLLFAATATVHAQATPPGVIHADGYTYCQADYPTSKDYQPLPDADLVHLQALFRHGDRSPIYLLKSHELLDWRCDTIKEVTRIVPDTDGPTLVHGLHQRMTIPKRRPFNHTIWPNGTCALGQLTQKGFDQHLRLGGQLRDIYVARLAYLPAQLDNATVQARFSLRSSDVWRTKQSAYALLGGLWPAEHRTDDAMVLSIDTYPHEVETMWGAESEAVCPRLIKLYEQMKNETEWRAYLNRHQRLRKELDGILETADVTSYQKSFVPYMDPLVARLCQGMALPCRDGRCVTTRHALELSAAANEEYTLSRSRLPQALEANRLSLGFFLDEMREKLVAGASADAQPTKRRFDVFSGHDDTIYGIKGLLDAHDMRWPPYASTLLFELWQPRSSPSSANEEKPEPLLRILYNGRVLTTSWCDMNGCPLSKYLAFVEQRTPKDLDAECHVQPPSATPAATR